MVSKLNFILIEDKPIDVAARVWRRDILKPAHEEVGDYWHKNILPKHFKPGAAQKYNHQARTEGYLKKKARLARSGFAKRVSGQLQDNVFTGRMRASLKRSSITRGYPSRVSVSMFGPRYTTMRVWKSNQPDKAAEITRVTQDEERELAQVMVSHVQKNLGKYRAGRRVTKG